MSGLVDKTDQGLAGTDAVLRQIANLQPQGPLAYTTYDFLKHFAGAISIAKFIAHVFSFPIMVCLRRDFGMRYVDDVHVALAFCIWQVLGIFSFGAGLAGDLISPLVNVVAWVFLPLAFYHRYRAKRAALKGQGYSYYPGMPLLAPAALAVAGRVLRLVDGLLRTRTSWKLSPLLTHLEESVNPEAAQGLVRKYVEPPLVFFIGVVCGSLGGIGFGLFLVWTSMFLFINEVFSQREMWELYLDQVDSQVIAEERQRLRSGDQGATGLSSSHGFSLASMANPRDLLQRLTPKDASVSQAET